MARTPAVSSNSDFSEQVRRALIADIQRHKEAYAEWGALKLSLDALYEAAIVEVRPFEWACSDRERLAALDYCVSRSFQCAT